MTPIKLITLSEELYIRLNQFPKEVIMALLELKFDKKWEKFFIDENLVFQRVANQYGLGIDIITDQDGKGNEAYYHKETRELKRFVSVDAWVEEWAKPLGARIVGNIIEWGEEE
jgi:hypothetical protein